VLQVFKPLATTDRVQRQPDLAVAGHPAAGYARHSITLGWEERLKTRGRRRTDSGIEFGTALPRGTVLREGDALVVEPLRFVAIVAERAEPVLVITPASPAEWGLFGYHLGNSHQPIMIADDRLICLDDLGMLQVLAQHRIAFVRDQRPFTPVGGVADHRHDATVGQDWAR
jgi:urease accessory protein